MKADFTVQRFRGGFAIVFDDPETGKRRRYTLDATNRNDAEAEARARFTAALAADTRRVSSIVESYLDAREAEGMITIQRRRDAWKAMKPFWADVDPKLIDDAMCQKYMVSRGVGPATVRLELMLLSSALGRAFGNAKPKVWLPRPADTGQKHLTRPEFKRFLDGVVAPHAKLYVMLGIFTLARPSAILELAWKQVDFERGLINLNPPGRAQTKKRRPIVPMNDMLRDALAKAYEARDGDFVIMRGGERLLSIKKAFQAASERSHVHVTPYTLRHTGAVWAAEQGIAMAELAQMLGHDDDRMTQKHYARYSPTYLRRVSDAVQAAFEGSKEPTAPVKKAA